MTNQILESEDNNKILSQVLADKIIQSRKIKNPSADDILSSIGNTRVVFK